MPKSRRPKDRKGAKKSRMPVAKQAEVLMRAALGQPQRAIRDQAGISRNAIATILASADVNRLRWEAVCLIASDLPEIARKMAMLAKGGDVTAGINLLKGLRVLNPRDEEPQGGTEGLGDLSQRSAGELEFFALHGRWPGQDDKVEEPRTITLHLER